MDGTIAPRETRNLTTTQTPWAWLVLALWLVSPGFVGAEAPEESRDSGRVWHTTLDAAVAEAQETNRYILVDLFADWCGWCHQLEDQVFTHPHFLQYAKDFVLLRVDTEDGAEGSYLQLRYDAANLPTTLILDKDMVQVGKVPGFAPMPTYVERLQEQVNAYLTILSFYDQVLAEGEPELQRQVATDLHQRGDGIRAARLYARLLEQIRTGTDAEAWLTYQLADAYRVGRDFATALEHLDTARQLAERLGGEDGLVERVDLLRVNLTQEAGDCDGAVSSLENFLQQHPGSAFSQDARKTLKAIQKGEVMPQCT